MLIKAAIKNPFKNGAGPYFKQHLMFALAILIFDQLSKWYVLHQMMLDTKGSIPLLPFLSFSMVWNTGISMGLAVDSYLGRWGLIVLTSAVSIWLMIWMYGTTRRRESSALALIVGGAVGNVIDRLNYGAVVDFVHLHAYGYNYYVFNVADAAITIGVVVLLIDSLRSGNNSPKNDANVNDKISK